MAAPGRPNARTPAGAILTLLFACSALVRAQGGPPLITDDPDTPGPGYWEINVSGSIEKSRHARLFEMPRIDVNYGVGRRIQLKYEMPWLRGRQPGEHVQTGLGSSELGLKWRFIGQEGQRLAWSVYPQWSYAVARSSIAKGLVEARTETRLPTEVTLEMGRVEANVEIGRTIVRHGPDTWDYGVATEVSATRRLELLAELHGEHEQEAPNQLVINLGARQKLSAQTILLFSAGRALNGAVDDTLPVFVYGGLQINLPRLYSFTLPGAK